MSRVLIVEDSPTQAQQLAWILEDGGLEVETAPDAGSGLKVLGQGAFDLVLSDLMLAGDSGFDLCQRIKSDPRLRRIPVVVCTAQADPLNVLRGLQAGADGFITKDREPDEILACVRRALGRPVDQAGEPTRVAFLGQTFEVTAGREALLDVLALAFEDVVQLSERQQTNAVALRELNARLQVSNRELEAGRDALDRFFHIATSLRDPDSQEKTFDLVLRFCQSRGYDLALLALVDRAAGVVRAVRAAGTTAEVVAQTVRPLDGPDVLAIVAREGNTVVIPDATTDPRCDHETAAAAGVQGMVVLPLRCGEILGVLLVASRVSLEPPPEELRTLETLASQAARALSGLLQLEEIRRLNSQLAQRNEQLQDLAEELAETAQAEREALEELKRAESQLVQAEKLSSLGRMVAGVAHEINNPLAFVTNNVAVLQRDIAQVRELINLYLETDAVLSEHRPDLVARIQELAEEIDLQYTLDGLDKLTVRSREGLKRIQQIVKNLRDFARLDEGDLKEADLNAGIRSTLDIIRTQARDRQVELEEDLTPLPPVTCYPAKINQVVLNLLSNALDASSPADHVTIATRPLPDSAGVEITVTDTGRGIDPAIRPQIFDPFFTTKPIGQGTGLGLSISYGIIQDHGGSIDVDSTPGQGSRFSVRLPLQPPASSRPASQNGNGQS